MPRSPEPGCEPPSLSPTGYNTASEYPDETSQLMVTTRSITSIDSSSFMSDEHDNSKACVPLMPQSTGKSDSLSGSTSPKLKPSSSPHDDSVGSANFQLPQTAQRQTALGSGMPHHDIQQAKDESIMTTSADAGMNAHSRDAEVSRKPKSNRFFSSTSRLGRLVPVEGSIGSFDEYTRPNAETSFLFSFTPITGTGHCHKQSSGNTLIASLENVQIDKGPPAAGQKSVKLRRRRCVDVRSLPFDDWRPCTDSQAPNHQELSQAARKKSASDSVLQETGSHQDTKTTADRRRFDFLVSRLQQKLSERSQDSANVPRIPEVSRHSSHAGSTYCNKPPFKNTTESSQTAGRVNGKGPSSNHRLGTEEKAYADNENQGEPELEAPSHTEQQSAPGLHQSFPKQLQGNAIQPAEYLPQLFTSMMQPLPHYPGPWTGHNDQALSLGQPTYPTMAFQQNYPSPSLQPQIAAWPHAAGAPYFGTYHYVGHPQETAPCPPPTHYTPLLSVPTQPHRPRSPKESKSRGHIRFIPLNATDQQKIEEHIEHLKATVPSFAMVSKRRQRQRWENQQRKQQEESTQKSMHNLQPMPLPPVNHWGPQPYQQLQQQFYHHGYIPATATAQASMHGPPPLYNPMSFANIPWSNL